MTKLFLGAALVLALASSGFAAPAEERAASGAHLAAAAAVFSAAAPSALVDPENGRQGAVDACVQQNAFGPAKALEVVGDGLGDWLVWVEDKNGGLWSCNADAAALVYVNVLVQGDLLEGHGAEFLGQGIADASRTAFDPHGQARELCVGVASLTQDVSVVASAPDGLGDSIVWLRLGDGQLWICNASADKLFVFEPVGFPIDSDETIPALTAAAAS